MMSEYPEDLLARLSRAYDRACKRQPFEEPRVSIFASDLEIVMAKLKRLSREASVASSDSDSLRAGEMNVT